MAMFIEKLPDIKKRTSLSRSTIYAKIAKGTFPKQISLGGRSVGWVSSEIDDWITNQIKISRNGQKG